MIRRGLNSDCDRMIEYVASGVEIGTESAIIEKKEKLFAFAFCFYVF